MQENNLSIKLRSRYSEVDTEALLVNDNKAFITTNSTYVRKIINEDHTAIEAIDFEGGPMLGIGDTLFGRKIKSIKACYYLELE